MALPAMYTVTAKVISVTIVGAGVRTTRMLRRGDVLPAGVDPVQLQHLRKRGMVERTILVERPGVAE